MQGDPGDGKSTLILNIAAKLSRGECIDENMNITEPVNVIYQTAEDGLADTVKPRLEAANADCSRISIIDESIHSPIDSFAAILSISVDFPSPGSHCTIDSFP